MMPPVMELFWAVLSWAVLYSCTGGLEYTWKASPEVLVPREVRIGSTKQSLMFIDTMGSSLIQRSCRSSSSVVEEGDALLSMSE